MNLGFIVIELELSYEPSALLRWCTLVSEDFPTCTGRRMYWILQRCMGRAFNFTYFASPPLSLCLHVYARRLPAWAWRRRRRLSPHQLLVPAMLHLPLHPVRNNRGSGLGPALYPKSGYPCHLCFASGCPALRVAVAVFAGSVFAAALFLSAISTNLLLVYADPCCPSTTDLRLCACLSASFVS